MRHSRSQPKTSFRLGDVLLDQFSFRGDKSVTVTMPDGTARKDKSVIIRPQTEAGRLKVAIRSHNYALVQEKRGNAKLLKGMAGAIYNKLAKVSWWQREARELKRLLDEHAYASINEITDPIEKDLFIDTAKSNSQSWKKNHKLWPLFVQYEEFIASSNQLDTQVKTLMGNLGGANPLKTTLVVTR